MRLALALAVLLGVASANPGTDRAPVPATARLLSVKLTGVVSPLMDDVLGEALEHARGGGYRALVVELDTPGGLESSMRDMVSREFTAPVPVIVWVAPSGGHAA